MPLLQFTLQQLYSVCSETGVLTFDAYRQLGGLRGCVARHAEVVFSSLPAAEQRAWPLLFRQLICVSEENSVPVRQRCSVRLLQGIPGVGRLVQVFVDARLLIQDQHLGEAIVEIAHEALLQHWRRLADWLREESELLRKRSRLMTSHERWLQAGRARDLLLPRGTALAEADDVIAAGLLSSDPVDGVQSVQLYVQKSHAAARRRRRLRKQAMDSLAESQVRSLELSFDSV
ncbi:MAG: hypothetical protein ACK6EB_46225, partial [Planctomyces sp.]